MFDTGGGSITFPVPMRPLWRGKDSNFEHDASGILVLHSDFW